MNTRLLFIFTAISGLIGMVSLITTSLCRFWISENPLHNLSDEGIDQLITIIRVSGIATVTSKVAIPTFAVFFALYFVSRRQNRVAP